MKILAATQEKVRKQYEAQMKMLDWSDEKHEMEMNMQEAIIATSQATTAILYGVEYGGCYS